MWGPQWEGLLVCRGAGGGGKPAPACGEEQNERQHSRQNFFCHTKFLHCPYAAMIRFWGGSSRFNTPVTIFACFCNMKRVFYSLQETSLFHCILFFPMRAVGCWKQTPGLLFSEEKSYCKGGRRLLRLGKRPVDASCGRDAKRRTSYRCPSFLEGAGKIDISP